MTCTVVIDWPQENLQVEFKEELHGPRSEALKTEKIKEEKDVHHQAITTSKGTQTEDDDDGEEFSAKLLLGAHGTISGDYVKRVTESDMYFFKSILFSRMDNFKWNSSTV